MLKNTF